MKKKVMKINREDHNMEKNQELELMDIFEALSIPGLNEIIRYKIKELKENPRFAALISAYKEKKRVFKDTVYDSYMRLSDKPGGDPGIDNIGSIGNRLYWFELVRYRRDNWNVYKLEPSPPPYYDRREILPCDIIDCVKDVPINPENVQTLSDVPSNLYGKSYDLQLIRFSLHYVCGSIRENRMSLEERHKKKRYSVNENLDNAYRVFFYYLHKFPEIRDYFFNELFGKIGPLLEDSSLIDREDII
jgi:hypothetical protein